MSHARVYMAKNFYKRTEDLNKRGPNYFGIPRAYRYRCFFESTPTKTGVFENSPYRNRHLEPIGGQAPFSRQAPKQKTSTQPELVQLAPQS